MWRMAPRGRRTALPRVQGAKRRNADRGDRLAGCRDPPLWTVSFRNCARPGIRSALSRLTRLRRSQAEPSWATGSACGRVTRWTGVFFRSLATRGHLGGLSRHTGDVVALLDAFGFDHIVIETVGAGQSEVDIMRYAHTVVVALAPGLGDDMQAIKAGILEIGDVFCVNKADLPGAERTRRDIEMMLAMREPGGWTPPVVSSVAVAGKGLEGLVGEVLRHQTYLVSSGLLRERNRGSSTAVLEEYLHLLTVGKVMESASRDGSLDAALDDLVEGKSGPMEMAERLLRRYRE